MENKKLNYTKEFKDLYMPKAKPCVIDVRKTVLRHPVKIKNICI